MNVSDLQSGLEIQRHRLPPFLRMEKRKSYNRDLHCCPFPPPPNASIFGPEKHLPLKETSRKNIYVRLIAAVFKLLFHRLE